MRLLEIQLKDREMYQSFVQANGYFLQSWAWGDFQQSLGTQVFRFMIVDDNGAVMLSAQLLLRIANSKQYLYSPYGPVISSDQVGNFETLIHFFITEIGRHYPQIVFVRMEPIIPGNAEVVNVLSGSFKHLIKKSLDLNPHQTLILDLTKSIKEIEQSMHPKTRYNIKLAEKKDLKITVLDASNLYGRESEQTSAAIQLICDTSKRAGIRSFGFEYYHKLLGQFHLGQSAFRSGSAEMSVELHTAWHENDLLAANIILYYGDAAVYLFGGSALVKRNLMAPYLLHSSIIANAKQRAFKKYNFWGVELDPKHPWYGFSRFKLGFGGEVVKYAGTWDFVLNRTWYNVYKLLRVVNRKLKKINR